MRADREQPVVADREQPKDADREQPSVADYLERSINAPVYDVAVQTPLERASRLSSRLGNEVLLKREDMQPIFSFKIRGAYNKMVALGPDVRSRGVVASSAGNHAQGVALAAHRLGCAATIVMPVTTPSIKIAAVAALGATIELVGDSYSEAESHARELVRTRGLTLVHPYDDPDIIAGQGTVGLEILRQAGRTLDAIFVPVGGGGLIAGVAAVVKRLRPRVRIIGVEPDDADSMARSLRDTRRVALDQVGLFADGVAVRQVGEEPLRLCRELVDEMVLVDTDAICAAIKDVFEDTRTVLEPAGALAVAGLKAWVGREAVRDLSLVAVASGANMNFDRLRHVAERAEIGEEREALFGVTIPERPGSFKEFCALLGRRSVTEFNYRYSDAGEAHVFVGVEVAGRSERARIVDALQAAGLPAVDLSDDEASKLHFRHMVGGRADVADEVLYRFEFPERPGALIKFLEAMSQGWNISLFHYRNHGADYGRVLVGMQVPATERPLFEGCLAALGYDYVEETGNAAYRLFAR
ncbi:MAG TPA: threonine ammonia-lyase, biosynthetic [Candidatus Limnocylindrales bacterium]|nr:threonine ammonia-lyase, biosynthetic [Candidatus Limnocylindrales bacterium]